MSGPIGPLRPGAPLRAAAVDVAGHRFEVDVEHPVARITAPDGTVREASWPQARREDPAAHARLAVAVDGVWVDYPTPGDREPGPTDLVHLAPDGSVTIVDSPGGSVVGTGRGRVWLRSFPSDEERGDGVASVVTRHALDLPTVSVAVPGLVIGVVDDEDGIRMLVDRGEQRAPDPAGHDEREAVRRAEAERFRAEGGTFVVTGGVRIGDLSRDELSQVLLDQARQREEAPVELVTVLAVGAADGVLDGGLILTDAGRLPLDDAVHLAHSSDTPTIPGPWADTR